MSIDGYRSNAHVTFRCFYHVVWCTKFRRDVLTDEVGERLKEILIEAADELSAMIVESEVMVDHVHVIVDADPSVSIHRVVKRMKGRTSHHLRQEFEHLRTRLPTLWTHSYFISTTGGASLDVVRRYVETQKNV